MEKVIVPLLLVVAWVNLPYLNFDWLSLVTTLLLRKTYELDEKP